VLRVDGLAAPGIGAGKLVQVLARLLVVLERGREVLVVVCWVSFGRRALSVVFTSPTRP
jgi:hypothetical protein